MSAMQLRTIVLCGHPQKVSARCVDCEAAGRCRAPLALIKRHFPPRTAQETQPCFHHQRNRGR
eukprot:4990432-Alexandrium_andersonii.AAC.1